MINNSDFNLITFKAISDFTNQLGEIFTTKDKNHSLKLYEHLLNKTTLTHTKAINKHIEVFREFCISNREAITSKNKSKLVQNKVSYSKRVYIDFANIFKESDDETTNVIWKHLLTISALVDPAGKAKKVLQESKDTKEANFLSEIINKVETNVNPNANPLEAVSSIMSSGVFNELITGMNSGIQNGDLDLGKLMGTVQSMCSTLTGEMNNSSDSGEGGNPMNNILSGLMKNMGGGGGGGDGSGPDLSNLTSILGPMLSTLGKNNGGMPSVEEITKTEMPQSLKVKMPSISEVAEEDMD